MSASPSPSQDDLAPMPVTTSSVFVAAGPCSGSVGRGTAEKPGAAPRPCVAAPGPGGARHAAYLIITGTGAEGIPFATTVRVLGPAGVVFATVNSVDEDLPGATDAVVQLLVRA